MRRRRPAGRQARSAQKVDPYSDLRSAYLKAGFRQDEAAAFIAAEKEGNRIPSIGDARDPTTGRVPASWFIRQVIEGRIGSLESKANQENARRITRAIQEKGTKDGPPAEVGDTARLTVKTRGLIADLLRDRPSLSREDVLGFIKAAWPATRGLPASGRSLFSPALVLGAYSALRRENPSWGDRAACDHLARSLRTAARTIRKHLASARGKNS